MKKLEKKTAFEFQRHFTRFVVFRHANNEMKKHQNDFTSLIFLINCLFINFVIRSTLHRNQ